jgi:hypothetical protein
VLFLMSALSDVNGWQVKPILRHGFAHVNRKNWRVPETEEAEAMNVNRGVVDA